MRFLRAPSTNIYKTYINGKLAICSEVCAFGTLIMSTEVFRLIICKTI